MKIADVLDNDKSDSPQIDDMSAHAQNATELLKALASESRLMILCLLVDGEKSVGQLHKLTNRIQSSVSQELARLRRQDLVESRRDGKKVYYSIKSNEAKSIIAALHDIYCKS